MHNPYFCVFLNTIIARIRNWIYTFSQVLLGLEAFATGTTWHDRLSLLSPGVKRLPFLLRCHFSRFMSLQLSLTQRCIYLLFCYGAAGRYTRVRYLRRGKWREEEGDGDTSARSAERR